MEIQINLGEFFLKYLDIPSPNTHILTHFFHFQTSESEQRNTVVLLGRTSNPRYAEQRGSHCLGLTPIGLFCSSPKRLKFSRDYRESYMIT